MIRKTMTGFGAAVAALVVTGCAATGRTVETDPGWVCDGKSCRLVTDEVRRSSRIVSLVSEPERRAQRRRASPLTTDR